MGRRLGDSLTVHSVSLGDGTPVVMLPGSIANWRIWKPTMELLSARYQVVGVDHAGVGGSRIDPKEVTFETVVASVETVVRHRKLEPLVIVGDSHNVAVALEFALRHPNTVIAAAFCSGVPWGFDDRSTRQFVDSLASDFETTVRRFVEVCIPEVDAAAARQDLQEMIFDTGAETAVAMLKAYFGVNMRERSTQMVKPSLVIGGSDDSFGSSNPDVLEGFAALLPNGQLRLIDGAAHVPMLTRPVEVASHLSALIDDVTA